MRRRLQRLKWALLHKKGHLSIHITFIRNVEFFKQFQLDFVRTCLLLSIIVYYYLILLLLMWHGCNLSILTFRSITTKKNFQTNLYFHMIDDEDYLLN